MVAVTAAEAGASTVAVVVSMAAVASTVVDPLAESTVRLADSTADRQECTVAQAGSIVRLAGSTADRQECTAAQAPAFMAARTSEAWADVLERHTISAEPEVRRQWAEAAAG
jgi:hypothetical protein